MLRSSLGVLVLLVLSVSPTARVRADVCDPAEPLLELVPMHGEGDAALTDGWLVPEGRPFTSAGAVRLREDRAIEWDLGAPRAIGALLVQADANDVLRIEGSSDGRAYVPLADVPAVDGGGLRTRLLRGLDARVRFLRLRVAAGDGIFAVSEVAAACTVEPLLERTKWVRDVPVRDPEEARRLTLASAKLSLALLAGGALVFVVPRLGRGSLRRRATLAAIFVAAILAWLDFGAFRSIGRGPLHLWDSVHYFLGSKYAREVGYDRLYDCIAASSRRTGHGAVLDRGLVRRLADDALVPGAALGRGGSCDGRFTPARRAELDRDLATIRTLPLPYGMPVEALLGDRGYMASPFGTAWLRLFTHDAAPTRAFFTGMAILDVGFLVLAVVAIAWGFGSEAAAFVALALAVGEPWDFFWLGGTIDRFTWFFAVALGIAALARGRPVVAGTALAFAALHRLFPFALLAGVLAWTFHRSVVTRRVAPSDRAFLASAAVTLVVGCVAGLLALGIDHHRGFAERLRVHARTPVANEIGGAAALRLSLEASERFIDPSQPDALVPWRAHVLARDAECLPLRAGLLLAAVAFLFVRIARGASAPTSALSGGLVGLLALDVASYYAAWVVLGAALPTDGPRKRVAMGLAVAATQASLLLGFESLDRYAIGSIALACALFTCVGPTRPAPGGGDLTVRRAVP